VTLVAVGWEVLLDEYYGLTYVALSTPAVVRLHGQAEAASYGMDPIVLDEDANGRSRERTLLFGFFGDYTTLRRVRLVLDSGTAGWTLNAGIGLPPGNLHTAAPSVVALNALPGEPGLELPPFGGWPRFQPVGDGSPYTEHITVQGLVAPGAASQGSFAVALRWDEY
jgi:hypothetical protein